ncbi:STAS domain-containing protein [Streptomyces sp. NPDC013171]|jgi:SulP family sulfate permease|uniref:STAS domain-containing protein n=1 Tax=Streptomyces sp. NPDC013171 TaxID=3364863 RepID=UPI0026D5236A
MVHRPGPGPAAPARVTVLAYEGTSLFAELPALRTTLPDPADARNAVLVLVVRTAPDIPSSAILEALRRYAATLTSQGGRLVLAGVRPETAEVLRRTGIADHVTLVPADEGPLLAPLDTAYAEASAWLAAPRPADAERPSGGAPPPQR